MSATASSTNHFDVSRMPLTANRQFQQITLKSHTGRPFCLPANELQQD